MGSSILVNSELANKPHEIVHSKKVRVIPTRCNKSSTTTSVCQLVVSLEHKRWSEARLFRIFNSSFNTSLAFPEILINGFFELSCVNLTCSRNDNVRTNIVFWMELFNLFRCNWIDIISNTRRWLTHSMISKACIVQIVFHIFFWIHRTGSFVNYSLLCLYLSRIENRIANCIS